MNKELIKFIELCLADDVISDKEKKVIFRKAKELGVPKDECEIILDGLVNKNAQKKNQSTKPSKELPTEKLNKKQEDKVDSRQPVKKDIAKRRFSLSEIKIPLIIRLIINLFLGFGLAVVASMVFTGLNKNLYEGVILIVIILIIVFYFLIRFFKIQFGAFEFVYFSLIGFLNAALINNPESELLLLAVGVPFIFYVFIFYFAESDKKGVNKDIAKFEKRKYENSKTQTETKESKKIVNKDIEKIEKRRGRKD